MERTLKQQEMDAKLEKEQEETIGNGTKGK